MSQQVLTDKHFCYVIFLEMSPGDFSDLLKTNGVVEGLKYLDSKNHFELYSEAKNKMLEANKGKVYFDFDYDFEPFVFNKYINNKLDRAYKICIFEYSEEKNYIGKTSDVYCNGIPLFFDPDGNMIKNSLN